MDKQKESAIADAMRRARENARGYADFFDWPDKRIKELHIAKQFLESYSTGHPSHRWRVSPGTDPPDIVAVDHNDNHVAIEVTEIVDLEAIRTTRRSLIETWRHWTRPDLIAAVATIIGRKGAVRLGRHRYHGYWLLLHTDEPELRVDDFTSLIGDHVFGPCSLVDRVFVLFSYDPTVRGYPFVELKLAPAT